MRNRCKAVIETTVFFVLCVATGYANTDVNREFSLRPLRDPFWPVGYFPENWQKNTPENDKPTPTFGSDWDMPTSMIRVTGTSRLGDKGVAIINGDLKEVGDFVEISYSGRIYQWKLKKINARGMIQLDRVGVSSGASGFHPGDKNE